MMRRLPAIILGLLGLPGLLGVGACAAHTPVAAGVPAVDPRDLPPAAVLYTTEPAGPGVVGGPPAEALGHAVAAALAARGGGAPVRADATLAALGAWYARQVVAGRNPTSAELDEASARLGFLGQLYDVSVFPTAGPDAELWRDRLAGLPRNAVVGRFGVWVAPDGQSAVVAFAAVELTLEPFPRHLAVGAALRLRGGLAARFTHGQVFLTAPDGAVNHVELAGRHVDVTLPLARAGAYRVEVAGDGPSGPVVLANVPVYAGASEPAPDEAAADTGAAGDPAQQMFALLNTARRRAGVAPLAFDPQLAAVATAYCHEMVEGHFYGHVSPVTGTVADRLRRAGIAVTMDAENVAQGDSAATAHRALMDSPGHRANMLDPRFTHVGIGVVPTHGDPPLVATLVFARRTDPTHLTAGDVTAAIAALRRKRGAPALKTDGALQAAAAAGMKAYAAGGGSSERPALNAAEATLVGADRSAGIRRGSACAEWVEIHELADLDEVPLLADPRVKSMAVGVAPRPGAAPPSLAVMILADGANCR